MDLIDDPAVIELLNQTPDELGMCLFAIKVENIACRLQKIGFDASSFMLNVSEYPLFPMRRDKSWRWNLEVLHIAFLKNNNINQTETF